jgi:hypothetical protein
MGENQPDAHRARLQGANGFFVGKLHPKAHISPGRQSLAVCNHFSRIVLRIFETSGVTGPLFDQNFNAFSGQSTGVSGV